MHKYLPHATIIITATKPITACGCANPESCFFVLRGGVMMDKVAVRKMCDKILSLYAVYLSLQHYRYSSSGHSVDNRYRGSVLRAKRV